ncbi:MAG: response regulator [Christensenella sp.]|nr:response regulator [Christensenella sp.]
MKCLVVSDIEASKEEKIRFLHEMNLFSSIGSASTADQAIARLKKYSYEIILLDLSASAEANMNLLKWIRAAKIFVCVIVLSMENSVEYISEAFSYGVSDYILKPCTNKRFREGAMRAVSKRECMLQYKSMTQEEIDHCVSHSIYVAPDNNSKKGISNETFSFVRSVVSNQADGFTAADIAVSTGLSRITVRKYLDRMCENGMLKTELEYGEIGRPQKLYYNFELHKEK